MKNLSLELKVGSLIILTIIIFIYFAVQIGSLRLPWQPKGYIIFVYFDNIAGLEKKAPVRLAGVRIGVVQHIDLVDGRARIKAEIDPDVVIPKDAKANVSQMGIVGEKFLEIIGGSKETPRLTDGDTLLGSPPTSFDQVISVINSIGHDIKSLTASFKRTFASEQGEQQLAMVLKNLENITSNLSVIISSNQENLGLTIENIKELSRNINELILANNGPFTNTMGNMENFTGELSEKAPLILERLDELLANVNKVFKDEGNDLGETMKNFEEATFELKESLASLRSITGKIDEGKGTLGKLVNDEETHDNLNTALTSLEDTLVEAKDVLGRVSSYKTSIGYRAEYLSDADSWKHYISLHIRPRDDKYYLVEVVDSPFGYRTETTTETYYESQLDGEDLPDYWTRESEIKIEDKFLMNLQIAKEYHNLTFRAGLLETTGGFGLDLGFWNKNILFSLDAYDFGREENFHLKFTGRFKLYHGIYVVGGWEDILPDLEEDTIDRLYVGAGFIFTDEDLKYLLGIAATASGSM